MVEEAAMKAASAGGSGEITKNEMMSKMHMESKLKEKVEELKALSAKMVEMELRIRFLKTEIESKA